MSTISKTISLAEQIKDSLVEIERVGKQDRCKHQFDDLNCVHCGIEVCY